MTVAAAPLLSVNGLTKHFRVGSFPHVQKLIAVDDISFEVKPGETVGLVGESGSGKSTVARCVLRLVEPTSGDVLFDGTSVTDEPRHRVRKLYRSMQMVFQDPNSSLNPRMSIRAIVTEPLMLHLHMNHHDQQERAAELMELVGLMPSHLDRFPHQLSGGQRQRVGIARAIATNPKLVILDEPTSSLDVSVRGQILQLLQDLQDRLDLSYLFITHDLSVVRHVCDRVAVMYLGKIIEQGPTDDVFRNPSHPYSKALLSAVPVPVYAARRERFRLEGEIPSPINLPVSCRLYQRCPLRVEECKTAHPPLRYIDPDHEVACYRAEAQFQAAQPSSS